MKWKIVVAVFASVFLLSAMFGARLMVPVDASTSHPAASIWIEPSLIDVGYGYAFTIDVMVNVSAASVTPPGTGLYGWDYQLKWDATNLNLTSYTINIPPEWGANWFKPKDLIGDYNATHKYHWFGVSALAPAPPLNETTTTMPIMVCTYNFRVIETIYQPDPDEIGKLDLQDTKLSDDTGSPIIHTAFDALYRKCSQAIPYPVLRVIPSKVHGVCGESFNISISIYNLAAGWNLWGWEANLTFNTVHLDALASYEGPGLPGFAGPNGTYYINIVNDTDGWVLSAGGFLGNHTAPSSIGTDLIVSIIEFNASFQTIAPDIQESDFNLTGTKLVGQYPNGTLFNIPHTVENGKYNVPYKIVGWLLDCYTGNWRKKPEGYTQYYGLGINQTADSYEPQDLVILNAYLEYNFEPEAYKLVSFEVHGPPNPYYNISIYRTAYTNASGIATINFTIPGSGLPNWQDMVMGHWECYQAAQVKIYEKPFDWLYWKVGWIVELINVTVVPGPGGWVNPDGPKKCEEIEIIIYYKTISFMPAWVLFTVTVLDELLDPIQWEFWWVYVEPTEPVLCSERIDWTSAYSHIPAWTHVGKATVYVNAFTDLPSNCGCPYSPEATAVFWVMATADP